MPADPADARLRAAVHPDAWHNPTPRGRYDFVVVGGGTAGLVSAMGAAGLGARVALIERALLGGDCLNTGCGPVRGGGFDQRGAAGRVLPHPGVRAVEGDPAIGAPRCRGPPRTGARHP